MRIVRNIQKLRNAIRRAKGSGKRIGFVPTMGALHEGHLSLIRKAGRGNDFVVVSIFVNPIQFNQPEDLKGYPRTLKRDAALAAEAGCDLLFVPSSQVMYPAGFQTFVEVSKVSLLWEGSYRPNHFKGVATVVAKLFNLIQPDSAYFGQKDAQQARVIEQMIRDLHFPIRLEICPTVREPNGLAASSRNRWLSSDARRSSEAIFQALQEARRLIQWGERRGAVVARRMKEIVSRVPDGRLDYATIVDPDSFQPVGVIRRSVQALIALWIGKVRLIDSCLIHPTARNRKRGKGTV